MELKKTPAKSEQGMEFKKINLRNPNKEWNLKKQNDVSFPRKHLLLESGYYSVAVEPNLPPRLFPKLVPVSLEKKTKVSHG